jgi:hypothetical protein
MTSIIRVETETIDGAVYLPASEAGPWTVNFSLDAPSPELAEALTNSGQPITVEVTEFEEGTGPVGPTLSGIARVITGDDFLLVGRTDMVPVEA